MHVTIPEILKVDFQRIRLLRGSDSPLWYSLHASFYSDIHERQFDTTGEEWSLVSGLNGEGSSGEELFVFVFTHEVSCIGLVQRNASFLTSAGFSLDNVESWFGVLSLSWEESVDSFVSISDSSLSGVSSLGILLAVAPCAASSKCTTMTLVLSARRSLSRHLDNARWINLLRKFVIISIYRSLTVVERMIAKPWVAVLWYYILMLHICNKLSLPSYSTLVDVQESRFQVNGRRIFFLTNKKHEATHIFPGFLQSQTLNKHTKT